MKNPLKAIRFIVATLLIVIASQATVLAEINANTTAPAGLSAAKVVSGFVLLLLVLLAPLIRISHKVISHN